MVALAETLIDPEVEWLLAIAGAITAITIIVKAVGWLRKRARRFEEFFDDYFGTPADPTRGKDAEPGVMARLSASESSREVMTEKMDETIGLVKQLKDRMEYEMSTNGGGSMRDEVRTLGVEQKRQAHELADISASADKTHRMLSERLEALESVNVDDIMKRADDAHADLAARIAALEKMKGTDDD